MTWDERHDIEFRARSLAMRAMQKMVAAHLRGIMPHAAYWQGPHAPYSGPSTWDDFDAEAQERFRRRARKQTRAGKWGPS